MKFVADYTPAGFPSAMVERGFKPEDFPIVVAHRGASSTRPENTLASFEEALRTGAQLVEMDVRLTADGAAVVIHDADVSRTTDGIGFVHELTLEQVLALNGGGDRGVPTLIDVLELVSGRGGVALEMKNIPGDPAFEADRERAVEESVADLERSGFAGPVLFLSFNPHSVAAVRRLAPELPTGFLTADGVAPAAALAHAREAGHDFVLPGSRALLGAGQEFVAAAHAADVRVGTWTVDDAPTIRKMFGWGVDAVASNDPATAAAVLAERRG